MCTEKDKRAEHQLPPALGSPPRVAATARRTVQCVSGPGEGRGVSVLDPVPGSVVCTAVRGADRTGKRLGSDPFWMGLFS